MKRWSHAHSLLIGSGGGIMVAGHAWTYLLVLTVGVVIGRVWHRAKLTAKAAGSRALELHQSKLSLDKARRREIHSKTWDRRRTKAQQEREVKRAYIDGARDAVA